MISKTRGTAGACDESAGSKRGSALVPTLIVVSAVATLGLAMLTTSMAGARSVNFESDDYSLTSAVESVSSLVVSDLWSGYLSAQGGAAGTISSLRAYLDGLGVPDAGPGGAPDASMGVDWSHQVAIPVDAQGQAKFHNVNVDAVRLVRRDEDDATQLYVTVSASTTRGEGLAHPTLDRGVQIVYTIQPEDFAGFDYALLGNNVNCLFCHAQIDSAERYFSTDPNHEATRIKVGTLESLAIRHDMDGLTQYLNDLDADSNIAGALYVRGQVTDHDGNLISDWNSLSFESNAFDSSGHLVEDAFGNLTPTKFSPAGQPFQPLENLYLDYPTDYAQMIDGALPESFPPPIPDNGGQSLSTSGSGAGNKVVDQAEFDAVAAKAQGSITAGVINVHTGANPIDTNKEFSSAVFKGNLSSLSSVTQGHVILYGTAQEPIHVDGEVAIDGDLVIMGAVEGKGSIIASGNVYIPTDLVYNDGTDANGIRTFGLSASGTANALGLAAGGNIIIGDYARPASIKPDKTYQLPGTYEIIPGDSSGDWSFSLAEMSLFNRGEWARTQPYLPAPGEADQPSSTWSVQNPGYQPGYLPRYYHFGPGDEIPIYNKGSIGFDAATGTWVGDHEVPNDWDTSLLTLVDPNDMSSPYLYDANGNSIAALLQMTPEEGWISDSTFKNAIEWFAANRTEGQPFKIDGLLYTNNAIMAIVNRYTSYEGQMVLNGAMVSADLGVLVPSIKGVQASQQGPNMPNSVFRVGLQLNYDERVRDMLNVQNPNQVKIERTLWKPTANML